MYIYIYIYVYLYLYIHYIHYCSVITLKYDVKSHIKTIIQRKQYMGLYVFNVDRGKALLFRMVRHIM